MSSGPFAAAQSDRPTVVEPAPSPRSSPAPTGRRLAVHGARATLVALLLVTTLGVAVLAAALASIFAVLTAPWWIYRLWLRPALDRSPSSAGALLDVRPGRDGDAPLAASSGI
ncbi:hypothetical protein ACFWGN_08625 [Oerskovia sp. NPDC060338]|uniref:hypothetical protein n=1 Tax=unclassified Oerskovia TaxID=2619021 RepID=UPI003663B4EB